MSIRLAWFAILAACGGGDGSSADAPGAPITVMVTGTATERSASGSTASAGVLVEAYANTDENTVVASATTDAQGNYSLTVTSTGAPLDGYLKASKSGLLVTYLYPAEPLADNFAGASINMLSQSTFDTVANTLCRATQDAAKGAIAVLVEDSSKNPVAGATVASSPAATKACYDDSGFGLPSSSATASGTDGLGYLFNVTGSATVSATKSGTTFLSHAVKVRAGAFTTTLVHP